MKNLANTLQKLSLELKNFSTDSASRTIIDQAIAQNSWFSERDIRQSIDAIRTEMLEREKFTAWMASYNTSPTRRSQRVAIITAGNIPLVGFFDLLCTLAAGDQAWVKPSSKDRVLMEYVISLMQKIDPTIPIYIYNDAATYDTIIATGGERANQYFEERFKGVRRLCRSDRHSIAVLSGKESEEQMQLLSEDIYSYSGLGCRNVSMIIAPKGYKIELAKYSTSEKYHNSYLQTKALMTIKGEQFIDVGESILIPSRSFPNALSSLSVWEYESLSEVEDWIAQNDNILQCIVSEVISHLRRVDFGQAQHPTLFDYADGVDTMKFLKLND